MSVFINLFGAPGSTKTTIAYGLGYLLKSAGYSCYVVSEYPEELVYDEDDFMLTTQQSAIYEEQLKREERAFGQVDYIVCMCPALLCTVYADKTCKWTYDAAAEFVKRQGQINILLTINHDLPWSMAGRIHDFAESMEIERKIRVMLDWNGIQYREFKAGAKAKEILKVVKGD